MYWAGSLCFLNLSMLLEKKDICCTRSVRMCGKQMGMSQQCLLGTGIWDGVSCCARQQALYPQKSVWMKKGSSYCIWSVRMSNKQYMYQHCLQGTDTQAGISCCARLWLKNSSVWMKNGCSWWVANEFSLCWEYSLGTRTQQGMTWCAEQPALYEIHIFSQNEGCK